MCVYIEWQWASRERAQRTTSPLDEQACREAGSSCKHKTMSTDSDHRLTTAVYNDDCPCLVTAVGSRAFPLSRTNESTKSPSLARDDQELERLPQLTSKSNQTSKQQALQIGAWVLASPRKHPRSLLHQEPSMAVGSSLVTFDYPIASLCITRHSGLIIVNQSTPLNHQTIYSSDPRPVACVLGFGSSCLYEAAACGRFIVFFSRLRLIICFVASLLLLLLRLIDRERARQVESVYINVEWVCVCVCACARGRHLSSLYLRLVSVSLGAFDVPRYRSNNTAPSQRPTNYLLHELLRWRARTLSSSRQAILSIHPLIPTSILRL